MKILLNKKLSGYDLIKQIEEHAGTWKPSFGSIYPLLEKLLRDKLVKVEAKGRRKIYYLTNEGKKQLKIIDKSKNIIIDKMIATCNAFSRITDRREIGFLHEVFNSLKRGQLPFKDINPEINEFRATLYDIYSKGKARKKIKAALRETVKKLKSIK